MPRKPRLHEQGSMLVTTALLFIFLIGTAAVAVDVGHLMSARNELQNAADSAALAGANCLDKTTASSGTDCTSTRSTTLNWSIAGTKATNSIGLNKTDGTSLVDGTVTTGYKNMNSAIGSSGGLQPTTLSPVGSCSTPGGACDKPAVMVSLSKDSGKNGGPVQTLITAMFGGSGVPISVNAIAVISSPSTVIPGSLVPIAINKCLYDLYWDSTTNMPKNATASSLDVTDGMGNIIASIPQTIGQPWEFRIGSSYHYGSVAPGCDSGQWTTFNLASNSASDVKGLVNNGNPIPLSIGDPTWLKPGTSTSNYNDLDAQFPTPLSPPTANTSSALDVAMPVVDVSDLSSSTNAQYPIIAFAAFHIDDVQGGSNKYVQGHFIPSHLTPGSTGIGPSYGVYTPPRIAQ